MSLSRESKSQGRSEPVNNRLRLRKGAQESGEIPLVGPNPEVEVLGELRGPVDNCGLAADEQVFNPLTVKASE
ncbi:MAG: hypothetical protein FD180_1353 [Planctomycetota bacterium]|nr:MAG: hypothetical protein FD180_1353 [Planctomycetota bacterium]